MTGCVPDQMLTAVRQQSLIKDILIASNGMLRGMRRYLHEGCQALDTFNGHGVVDGGSHAAHRSVSLELSLQQKKM